jgi:hypothetical protein
LVRPFADVALKVGERIGNVGTLMKAALRATLSERSDDEGSWLIEVAALATGNGSVACHALGGL